MYSLYTKLYKSPMDLVKKLQSQNLQIANEQFANKNYLFFVVLEILYQKQIVEKNIRTEIKDLLQKYPATKNFINSMGIPKDWIK